jgi:S-(hydroxymethyl)glutathione dehydrogenase/alcohol dehydrogenase
MKAAVLRQFGRLDIEDVALDGPRDAEVRIRVEASGLCHSDYHIMMGDMPLQLPLVLGHEAAGIVEAVGADVRGLAPGDRVVTCISAYCGQCRECQTGHTHRCDDKPGNRAATDEPRITAAGQSIMPLANLGGFAEEMVVHHRAVVKLPEGVPWDAAALLGCAVLTGVGAALHGGKVTPGATVVVIGCGGVGLNVQGARMAGAAQVIAVDLSEQKLALAKVFGATDTVLGGADVVATVQELTKGGADFAFEVIGLTATINDAIAMLRKGGTAVLVGVAGTGVSFSAPITPFVVSEKRIIGTSMGSAPFQLFIPELANSYLRGRLKLDELISARIPLEAINDGYARMAKGEVARSVIVF